MNDVKEFLEQNPVEYLATIGLDGEAKVRPIMYYFEENGKYYFCTSTQKPMYKELEANPKFELNAANPEFKWLRISGEVEWIDDIELKQKVIDSNELVESLYGSGDNPIFAVFTIKEGAKAVIADFSGEPAKKYEL